MVSFQIYITHYTSCFRYATEEEVGPSVEYYPQYCSGPAYATSAEVMKTLWQYLLDYDVHYLYLEDVFLTGKLATATNISVVDVPHLYQKYVSPKSKLIKNRIYYYVYERSRAHVPRRWYEVLSRFTDF